MRQCLFVLVVLAVLLAGCSADDSIQEPVDVQEETIQEEVTEGEVVETTQPSCGDFDYGSLNGDKCYYEQAVIEGDISACAEMRFGSFTCINDTILQHSLSYADCAKAAEVNSDFSETRCQEYVAEFQGTLSACSNIDSEFTRSECIVNYAIPRQDVSLCGGIEYCEDLYYEKTGNIEECSSRFDEYMSNMEHCVANAAILSGDVSNCEARDNTEYAPTTDYAVCVKDYVDATGDLDACENIDESLRDSCVHTALEKEFDVSGCKSLEEDFRSSCFEYIALNTPSTTVCNELGGIYKDVCLSRLLSDCSEIENADIRTQCQAGESVVFNGLLYDFTAEFYN